MDLYSKKDKSIPQKIILTGLEILLIAVSYWILFGGGYNALFSTSHPVQGNPTRHLLLFAFNLTVFFRLCLTFFYLVKRHIPWEEAFSVPFAFAIYYIGFALLGYPTYQPVDLLDGLSILLFLAGSFLNSGSELMRDNWKKDPAHKGKLYTRGLFKYAMHINYFGDLLWVTAYAIVTRNGYAAMIPVLLFCLFAFYNVPKLDQYLASKYGQAFDDYRNRTKKLIPFIY